MHLKSACTYNGLYILPSKILLAFLDAKSLMMRSMSMSSNNFLSTHSSVAKPFNLSRVFVDLK